MDGTLKQQVQECLKKIPETRDSDIRLTLAVWRNFYPQRIFKTNDSGRDFIFLDDLFNLPREDNVKRIRAKLSEEALKRIEDGKIIGDEEFYLPTSRKVAEQRQILDSVWEKFLGYFRRPAPTQSEQLPRPVGQSGFTKIDDHNFIAEGRDGKRYKVYFSPAGFSCECESFRFSQKNKPCKHIKAVEKFNLNQKKSEAVLFQQSIFSN